MSGFALLASVGSIRDQADIDAYFKSKFGRSSAGAILDRAALYDLGTIRAMARSGKLDDPGAKDKLINVQPTHGMGSQSGGGGGYTLDEDRATTWAKVSRVIQRMTERRIGSPSSSAADVMATSWQMGGDFRGRSSAPELEHLTTAGFHILNEAAGLADGWAARARNKGKLTAQEVEFVRGIDLGPDHEALVSGAPLESDAERRPTVPYRNVAERVFGHKSPLEKAEALLRNPAIRDAIEERRGAEILLGKRPSDIYAVVTSGGGRKRFRRAKLDAERQAAELFGSMWWAWNAAKRGGRR